MSVLVETGPSVVIFKDMISESGGDGGRSVMCASRMANSSTEGRCASTSGAAPGVRYLPQYFSCSWKAEFRTNGFSQYLHVAAWLLKNNMHRGPWS
jgi:hypothetical protein